SATDSPLAQLEIHAARARVLVAPPGLEAVQASLRRTADQADALVSAGREYCAIGRPQLVALRQAELSFQQQLAATVALLPGPVPAVPKLRGDTAGETGPTTVPESPTPGAG